MVVKLPITIRVKSIKAKTLIDSMAVKTLYLFFLRSRGISLNILDVKFDASAKIDETTATKIETEIISSLPKCKNIKITAEIMIGSTKILKLIFICVANRHH